VVDGPTMYDNFDGKMMMMMMMRRSGKEEEA
jgi:hypothetical protein